MTGTGFSGVTRHDEFLVGSRVPQSGDLPDVLKVDDVHEVRFAAQSRNNLRVDGVDVIDYVIPSILGRCSVVAIYATSLGFVEPVVGFHDHCILATIAGPLSGVNDVPVSHPYSLLDESMDHVHEVLSLA